MSEAAQLALSEPSERIPWGWRRDKCRNHAAQLLVIAVTHGEKRIIE